MEEYSWKNLSVRSRSGFRFLQEQIREKRYEEKLIEDGMKRVLAYGIACYRKECEVKMEE